MSAGPGAGRQWRSGSARLPLLWLCAVAGCSAEPPRCSFGPEHVVFESEARTFHELRLVRLPSGLLALFSNAAGLHALPLDAAGLAREPARVLLEACDAGFDALPHGAGLVLACARRARDPSAPEAPGTGMAGAITLYNLDAGLAIEASRPIGAVGRASHGVALAERAGQLALLWQDAAISGERIWFAEPLGTAPPRQLSSAGWDAGAPSLRWAEHAAGPRLAAVWAETRQVADRTRSRVLFAEPHARSAPRVIVEARDPAPTPRLAPGGHGLVLAFRDRRERGRRTGLYFARLDPAGALTGEIVRAGRADGAGVPVVEPCQGGLISALPRTLAGDYFVGVLWADQQLSRLTQEQQFYEDSREFDRVALHCGGPAALLLISERRSDRGAALRSASYRCQ